jgi:hypothetical protein
METIVRGLDMQRDPSTFTWTEFEYKLSDAYFPHIIGDTTRVNLIKALSELAYKPHPNNTIKSIKYKAAEWFNSIAPLFGEKLVGMMRYGINDKYVPVLFHAVTAPEFAYIVNMIPYEQGYEQLNILKEFISGAVFKPLSSDKTADIMMKGMLDIYNVLSAHIVNIKPEIK